MTSLKAFSFLVTLSLTFGLIQLADAKDGQYFLRISYANTCDPSNNTYILKTVHVDRIANQDYLNAEAELLKDITGANMVVKIEKCNKSKGTCQRLKNFKLDNICQLFEMKNVFWYPLIKAIYPQPKCPVIQKDTYHLYNGTLNANTVVKLDPTSPNYIWKFKTTVNNAEGKEIICALAEGYLEQ